MGGAALLIQVLRCFHPHGSLSRILSSRSLVAGPLPTPWRKPHYREYPPPRTPCNYCRLRILAAPLSSRLSALFLCCFAPVRTHWKRHEFSIVLAVGVCRLGYLLGAKLEKAQKTSPLASNCVWFWYICCSTKFSRREGNFQV